MTYRRGISTIYWLYLALRFVLNIVVVIIPLTSYAHGVAGQRFFPTTFAVDDPFISDEFSVLYNSIKMKQAGLGFRLRHLMSDTPNASCPTSE